MALVDHTTGTDGTNERLGAYIKGVLALEDRVVSTFTSRKGEAGDSNVGDFTTLAPRGSDLFFKVRRYGTEAGWEAGPIAGDLFRLCFPELRGRTRTNSGKDIGLLKVFVETLDGEYPGHTENFKKVIKNLMKEGAHAGLPIMIKLLEGDPSDYRYRMAELCFQGNIQNKTATRADILDLAEYLDKLPYSTRKDQLVNYMMGQARAGMRGGSIPR